MCKNLDLKGKRKLEIGAGCCHIANVLKWDNYTAIDLSEAGFKAFPNNLGWSFIHDDVATHHYDGVYDTIIALDSLEHIPLTNELAHKIKSISHSETEFIGNVPLVNSQHNLTEDIEHEMSLDILDEFLVEAGFVRSVYQKYWTKAKMQTKEGKFKGYVYYPFCFFRSKPKLQ